MSNNINNNAAKKLLARVNVAGPISFGVAAANLQELKTEITNTIGLTEDKFYLLIDNSVILEDDDYFQALKQPYSSSLNLYLVEGSLKKVSEQENKAINEKAKFENTYLKFEMKAMEYILKRVKNDPSFLTPDIIPSLWRFAEENDEKEIRSFCVNQLFSNPHLVFKEALQSLEVSQWRTILESEQINCTEYELAVALTNWTLVAKDVSNEEKQELFSLLRLGTYSFSALENHIATLQPKVPERTLFPFIRYHTLHDEKFRASHSKLFEMRDLQKERFQPDQLSSRPLDIIPSAKNIPYSLNMSSLYPGLPNSYETLTSGKWNFPGCATNCSGSPQHVDAIYPHIVSVSSVTLSTPSLGDFASQGWGQGYIPQITIQYSLDGVEFITIRSLQGTVETPGPLVFEFPTVHATVIRLFSNHGYVATGSFIMDY